MSRGQNLPTDSPVRPLQSIDFLTLFLRGRVECLYASAEVLPTDTQNKHPPAIAPGTGYMEGPANSHNPSAEPRGISWVIRGRKPPSKREGAATGWEGLWQSPGIHNCDSRALDEYFPCRISCIAIGCWDAIYPTPLLPLHPTPCSLLCLASLTPLLSLPASSCTSPLTQTALPNLPHQAKPQHL